MQQFVIACAQMESRPMAVQENLERALELLDEAARAHASLVVLPETCTTGFSPDCTASELWLRTEPLPGPLAEKIGKTARQLGLHVAYPTYERGPEEGEVVFNSAALIDPHGDILGVYRKTHLFPTERRSEGGWSCPGDSPCVIETSLGRIGLTICYDGDFPELYRCEALAGADVILRPSAFLRSFEIWNLTNRARAFDNGVYIAACNAVGRDARGSLYFGHSMIVGPSAEVLKLGHGQEGVVLAEVTPRAAGYTDHLRDRNCAAYRGMLDDPAQQPPLARALGR